MDIDGKSYILNTIWRLSHIYNDFSQLIAHPLQRISESNTNYELQDTNQTASSSSENRSNSSITQQVQDQISPFTSRSTASAIRLEKNDIEEIIIE